MGRKGWFVIGAVVLAAIAVAVPLALTGGGPGKLSNADYARLWQGTLIGQPEKAVLARWPKNPYQHYSDNLADECYEWQDNKVGNSKSLATHLYNLCFKNGVLRSMQVF